MKNIFLSMDKQISFNVDDVSIYRYLVSVWEDVNSSQIIKCKG